MKVLFLYNRPRAALHAARLRGEAPDELLYGFETVKKYGVEPSFTDDGFGDFFGGSFLQFAEGLMSRRGRRVGFNLRQALHLRHEFARYDLIFATADSNALPVLFLKSLGLVRPPVVYGTIGLAEAFQDGEHGALLGFYRKLLRHATRVIHYGYGEGEVLREKYGLPEEKVRFVTLGTQIDFFEPARGAESEDFVFTLGVDRQRDWNTFFHAVKGLDARVKLVTDPLLVRRLNWPPNVEVLPLMNMVDLRDMIARARMVVLPVRPNRYTAGTFTLLQCMAAGKAVIVSRTQAIEKGYDLGFGREILAPPAGDMVQLRLAIKALLADPRRVAFMEERAAARAADVFSIERFARQIVDVFEEALG